MSDVEKAAEYTVSANHPECDGFAVCDANGDVKSCSKTKEEAQAQCDRLNAGESVEAVCKPKQRKMWDGNLTPHFVK